jgi:ubiquinone/menaquinone biosynthesis C-methylase UbiE
MKPSLPQRAYNSLADAYAAKIDVKAHNAFYERPATLSLIDEVAGKRILDAGCGPGVYTQWLLERGAQVVAFDANAKMLAYARKRTADRATFFQANMEEPLSFIDTDSIDGIVSALAITYVSDHQTLFAEFNRVLHSRGWLVISTEHPFFSYGYFKVSNYFKTKKVSSIWKGFGKPVRVPSYHHSLGSICEALSGNGYTIERIIEPKPTGRFRKANQKEYQKLMRFPLFICIRARKI